MRQNGDIIAFFTYHFAVCEARKLKPEIPMLGNDDIPIMHEIELGL